MAGATFDIGGEVSFSQTGGDFNGLLLAPSSRTISFGENVGPDAEIFIQHDSGRFTPKAGTRWQKIP